MLRYHIGLSILLHGVISLSEATSCVKQNTSYLIYPIAFAITEQFCTNKKIFIQVDN